MNRLQFALFAFVFSACGSDSPLKGEPVRLNSLAGSYALNDEGCTANVRESDVSLQACRTESFDEIETLEGSATFSDSSITMSGVWTVETGGGDCPWVCTESGSGSVSKSEGREDDGPFSTFAGQWSGSVSIDLKCKPSCEEAFEREEVYAYTFDVDVFGRTATIEHQGHIDGIVDVIGTDQSVSIDGDVIDKL